MDPPCAVCGKPAPRQCSRCKAVKYCGAECQRQHWTKGGHKNECRVPSPALDSEAAPAAAGENKTARTTVDTADGAAGTLRISGVLPASSNRDATDPAEIRNSAGVAAYGRHDFSLAAEEYAAAAALAPVVAKYQGNLAQALVATKQFEGALTAALQAQGLLVEAIRGREPTDAELGERVRYALWAAAALEGLGRYEMALTNATDESVYDLATSKARDLLQPLLDLRKRCELALIPTLSPARVQQADAADDDDMRTCECLVKAVKKYPEAVKVLWRKVLAEAQRAAKEERREHPLRLAWEAWRTQVPEMLVNSEHIEHSLQNPMRLVAALQLEAAVLPLAEMVILCIGGGPKALYGDFAVLQGPTSSPPLRTGNMTTESKNCAEMKMHPATQTAAGGGPLLNETVSFDVAVKVARYGLHLTLFPTQATLVKTACGSDFLRQCSVVADRRLREVLAHALSDVAAFGGPAHPYPHPDTNVAGGRGFDHLQLPTIGSLMWRVYHGARCHTHRFDAAFVAAADDVESWCPIKPVLPRFPMECIHGLYTHIACAPHTDEGRHMPNPASTALSTQDCHRKTHGERGAREIAAHFYAAVCPEEIRAEVATAIGEQEKMRPMMMEMIKQQKGRK